MTEPKRLLMLDDEAAIGLMDAGPAHAWFSEYAP